MISMLACRPLSFTSIACAHEWWGVAKNTIWIMVNSGSAHSSELSESKDIFDLHPDWFSPSQQFEIKSFICDNGAGVDILLFVAQCILVVPGIGSIICFPFRDSPFAVEGYSGGMESDEGGWSAVLDDIPSRSESPEGRLCMGVSLVSKSFSK